MNKEELETYINRGLSIREISEKYKKGCGTITYWMKKYGFVSKFIRKTWTDKEMIEAIGSNVTIADTLRDLGLQVRPGNYQTVKNFARENEIDLSHMIGQKVRKGGVVKRLMSELLVVGSVIKSTRLKQRLLKEGLLENECSECFLAEVWNGKKINMVLDHEKERKYMR
jgi:hypothetical protein